MVSYIFSLVTNKSTVGFVITVEILNIGKIMLNGALTAIQGRYIYICAFQLKLKCNLLNNKFTLWI